MRTHQLSKNYKGILMDNVSSYVKLSISNTLSSLRDDNGSKQGTPWICRYFSLTKQFICRSHESPTNHGMHAANFYFKNTCLCPMAPVLVCFVCKGGLLALCSAIITFGPCVYLCICRCLSVLKKEQAKASTQTQHTRHKRRYVTCTQKKCGYVR